MEGVEVACLDRAGTITAVNEAWTAFMQAHGGDPQTCSVGASYLDVCDRADDLVSRRIAEAIRAAGTGAATGTVTTQLACHGVDGVLWFDVAVLPRWGDDGAPLGAVVTLALVDGPDAPADAAADAREREAFRQRAIAELVAELTRRVLANAPLAAVGRHLVEQVAEILSSANASLVLKDAVTGEFRAVAGVGPVASRILRGEVMVDQATVEAWSQRPGPLTVAAPPAAMAEEIRSLAGPGVVAVFPAGDRRAGVITAFRSPGDDPFGAEDAALLDTVATQVAGALALGDARAAHQRLVLVEDRQRIARDLHDLVIQDLLSIGMELHREVRPIAEAAVIDRVTERLEAAIRRLRTVVFDVRDPAAEERLSVLLHATVAEAARSLGHLPDLSIAGPVDELEPSIADHLVAALREALSNVARHAGASRTSVSVAIVGDEVVLVVTDDGRGPSTSPGDGGTGLGNLADRSALLGGSTELATVPGGGAQLRWTAHRAHQSARPPTSG